MKTTLIERRYAWRALSQRDKHARLADMRRRHQEQVQFEMLRLQSIR